MSTADHTPAKSPAKSLQSNSRGQLAMLVAQFLLGMAVTLIGVPRETVGLAKDATLVLLVLHIIVAVGLLTGAIRAIPQSARLERPATGLAWGGFVAILIAFGAGIMTMFVMSDWWTYLMAASGSASLVVYGLLYTRAIR